jgi:O-antigen ligase
MADHVGTILMLMPAVMLFALSFVISPLNVIYWILAVRIPISPVLESTRIFSGMGPGALLNLIVILGAFVICFHHFKRIKQIPFVRSWLFFLLITFISILYSSEKMTGIRLWLNNMTYLSMLCIALTCISSLKDIRRWMLMFAGSSAAAVLIAFVYAALHGGLLARIFYPLTHPSVLAHYTVIMITITATTLMFLVERKSPVRLFLRLTIVLLAMALLLTQTRNAWIACWFSFLVFGFMRGKKLIICVCILVPLSLGFLPPVQERILDAFQNQHQTATQGMNSLAWRLTLWSDSVPWIIKRPLFGYGLTTFKPSSTIFSKFSQVQGSGAHNVYIELLFERIRSAVGRPGASAP